MHTVSEPELEGLVTFGGPLHVAFFGIAFGAFLSCLIVVLTVPLQDPRHYASFVALTWASAVLGLYFGGRALIDLRSARARLREIKRSRG